jgi:hypothetical protein
VIIKNVSGILPLEFGKLSELIEWETEEGNLAGQIPASISNNTKLKWFSVWDNKMSGNITEEICKVTSMKEIWLGINQFSGRIPSCISSLQILLVFDVADNIMSGPIPDSLGDIPGLDELYLNHQPKDGNDNKFTGSVPASFNKLTVLRWLYLNVETLEGPLPDLSSLVNLNTCSFVPSGLCLPKDFMPPVNTADCHFEDLPDCDKKVGMGKDCAIVKGWVPSIFSEGQKCCEVNAIICESGSIVMLMLADHGIHGQFPDIPEGSFKELRVLDLSNNAISGPIPGKINTFVKLQELNLAGNVLDGSIPDEISDLLELIILNMARNNLEGHFPASIFGLVLLEELYLSSNALLSGPVPDLPKLISIDIAGTDLEGWEEVSPPATESNSLPIYIQPSESQMMTTISIVIISVLAAVVLIGGIVIGIYRVRKRRQNKPWNEPGSSFTPSEAYVMDVFPSEDLIGSASSGAGKPRSSKGTKGKKLVWGQRISAGGFGEVWKGKYDGTYLSRMLIH